MSDEWRTEQTDRSSGLAFVGVLAVAAGAVTQTATALLVCVPLLGFALYDRLATASPPELVCERDLETTHPLPGREVGVTVTLRNVGAHNAPDVRVIDGVPDSLAVVSGSPRAGLSVAPDDSASFSYTIRARRGSHSFGPTTVLARNLSGSERSRTETTVETELDCRVHAESYTLADRESAITGMLDTSQGGSGVEFHSTREYHSTDPASRIDWRRLAGGGDLTTITYREANAAFVQLVVDRRASAATSFSGDGMTGRELSTYAAEMIGEMLLGEHHHVGVTGYGDDRDQVYPSNGDDHRLRLRRLFGGLMTHAGEGKSSLGRSSGRRTPDPAELADELADTLPSYTQFTLLSPLHDDELLEFAERLQAHGRHVVVVTPRQPSVETDGQRILTADRALRIDRLRRTGVTVFDWDTNEPLQFALEHRFGVGG